MGSLAPWSVLLLWDSQGHGSELARKMHVLPALIWFLFFVGSCYCYSYVLELLSVVDNFVFTNFVSVIQIVVSCLFVDQRN